MSISEDESNKIYNVIRDALLALCQEKPNDPVDFLSRKMLEIIGEDPNSMIRGVTKAINTKINDDIIISPEKLAIQNLKRVFMRIINYWKRFQLITI